MELQVTESAPITRIGGDIEDWIADFLKNRLGDYSGRIVGGCVVLEITSDDDNEDPTTTHLYYNWKDRKQLMGVLQMIQAELAASFQLAEGAV